ncbi:NodB-like y domain-containing protein [Bordetella sputigena]|uniref:polysaccharide deacetylase family protein n=1 Tax=Bordetella sputigena TaxID=1416810 RepID=UPI0039EFEFAF
MKEVKIVVTMDCEPRKHAAHPEATGPAEWSLGQRAAEGYAAIAGRYGLPVTFFVHPETAIEQAVVYDRLRDQGACLGLHVHAWKFAMSYHGGQRYMSHYGALSDAEQYGVLGEAGALWKQALGEWPLYFRPGTFSANDSIFRILADMGFRGGSCSVPGRVMPEMQAIWAGALPDAHRTHASFRQIAGTMDFVNMPVAVDFSRSLASSKGWAFHPDLRPDTDWAGQYGLSYDAIAESMVAQVIQRAPRVPVINLISHNHYDYCDENDPARIRYEQSLAALHAACAKAGLKPVGATLQQVVDEVLALPVDVAAPVFEGNIMDKDAGKA